MPRVRCAARDLAGRAQFKPVEKGFKAQIPEFSKEKLRPPDVACPSPRTSREGPNIGISRVGEGLVSCDRELSPEPSLHPGLLSGWHLSSSAEDIHGQGTYTWPDGCVYEGRQG